MHRAFVDEKGPGLAVGIALAASRLAKIPAAYLGKAKAKEVEANNISVRDRKGETTTMDLDAFIAKVVDEIKNRVNNG